MLPALIAAGGALLGGHLANEANRTNAREATRASQNMAREQMAFQERMSNTAYQRAAEDMKKAGLNPALGYSQGGASTPQGAQGDAKKAEVEDVLSKSISSALEARRLRKEVEAVESQAKLNVELGKKAQADALASATSAKNQELQMKALSAQLPAIIQEAKVRQKQGEYDEKAAPYDAIIKRFNSATGAAGNVMDIINPLRHLPKWKIEEKLNKKTGEIEKYRTP